MKLINILKQKVHSLKKESFALLFACQDPKTPWYAKFMILFTLGYLLSPIDLIPDFIPVLGYLDDLVIVPLLIIISIKLIPEEILVISREKAKRAEGKIKKNAWRFAILIILFWVLILFVIIRKLLYTK